MTATGDRLITLTGAAWPDSTLRLGRLRPPSICSKQADGVWHHYTCGEGDTYQWMSACADIAGHSPPAEFCDLEWGAGEHECRELLPHDVHACCCGEARS